MVLGLEQHLIVGVVRDRASGCQSGQPRAAPAAQEMVDAVVMDQRAAPAAAGGEAVRQHAHHRREILPRQRAVGGGAAHERIELVLVPFARGHFGDDLLGQHVERLLRDRELVELAAADAVEQRRAFHQLVTREREQPALGGAVDGMAGPPDALEEGRDRARRAELADEVDLADVDAQLERSRRHQRLELAVLEPLLGVEALLFGEAAMVRGHLIGTDALGQLARHPLGQSAGVDEDQRGAVRRDQLGQALIHLLPDLGRHHRLERRVRKFEGEVAGTAVAGVDDGAVCGGGVGRARPHQETRDRLDRLLGGGKAHAQ